MTEPKERSAFVTMLLGAPKPERFKSTRGATRKTSKAKRAMKSYGDCYAWKARREEKAKRKRAYLAMKAQRAV